jgi:uncharacterized phage protein (TIGR01671 family)
MKLLQIKSQKLHGANDGICRYCEGSGKMREVKFRGKRTDNKEWVYGYFIPDMLEKPHKKLIDCGFIKTFNYDNATSKTYEVIRRSIGQFTGFRDDKNEEIFEGDIVKINNHNYKIVYDIGSFMLVRCSENTDMYEQFEKCWNDDVYPLSQYVWENCCESDLLVDCEIIGNIYDNRELLD